MSKKQSSAVKAPPSYSESILARAKALEPAIRKILADINAALDARPVAPAEARRVAELVERPGRWSKPCPRGAKKAKGRRETAAEIAS